MKFPVRRFISPEAKVFAAGDVAVGAVKEEIIGCESVLIVSILTIR